MRVVLALAEWHLIAAARSTSDEAEAELGRTLGGPRLAAKLDAQKCVVTGRVERRVLGEVIGQEELIVLLFVLDVIVARRYLPIGEHVV